MRYVILCVTPTSSTDALRLTDIGGGSVDNETRYSLARIPLRWMVRECFKTNSGVIFKTDSLREIGIDPNTIYPSVLPRPPALFDLAKTQFVEQPPSTSLLSWIGSFFFGRSQATSQADRQKKIPFINEEDEELRDALSPKYDQLDISWFWWILEILPISVRRQKENNQWVSEVGYVKQQHRLILIRSFLTDLTWDKVEIFRCSTVVVSKSTDRSNSGRGLNTKERKTSMNPRQISTSSLSGSIDSFRTMRLPVYCAHMVAWFVTLFTFTSYAGLLSYFDVLYVL